jgi:2,3-bisphosphoglycerate-independent phosphoglycerate mutase
MKLVIIIPDGMPDWTYPELSNLSPAKYATTPGMTGSSGGQIGLVKTMHEGLPLGSLVGILGILGYDPRDYFPLGRSIFEARALGLHMGPDDIVMRCNIVCVSDDGILTDFTSGQIGDAEAEAYLAQVKRAVPLEIYHDLSYRNVLICRDCPIDDEALVLFEPHENVGRNIDDILPRYDGRVFTPWVDWMQASRRGGLMLWPWGQSRVRSFPPMPVRSLTVTALSFLAGMAMSVGGDAIKPQGATGYLDSDLKAKFETAIAHLDAVDVCIVHCNAPDEEGHIRSVLGKTQAIEDIDREIVRPMLRYLDSRGEAYRLLLIPDHYTVCRTGKHLPDMVPYAYMGSGIEAQHSLAAYSEQAILDAAPPVVESHELLTSLLQPA